MKSSCIARDANTRWHQKQISKQTNQHQKLPQIKPSGTNGNKQTDKQNKHRKNLSTSGAKQTLRQ